MTENSCTQRPLLIHGLESKMAGVTMMVLSGTPATKFVGYIFALSYPLFTLMVNQSGTDRLQWIAAARIAKIQIKDPSAQIN